MIQIVLGKLNLILLTWARGKIKGPFEVRLVGSEREFIWKLPDFNLVFDGTVIRCRESIIKVAHHHPIPVPVFGGAEAENSLSAFQHEVIRLEPWETNFSLPPGRTLFEELSEKACREIFAEFVDVRTIWIADPFCAYQQVLVPQTWRWSYREILSYARMKVLKRPIDWREFPHEILDRWVFAIRVGREGSKK